MSVLTSASRVLIVFAPLWLLPLLALVPPPSEGSLYNKPSPGCLAARCRRMALRMAAKLRPGALMDMSLSERECKSSQCLHLTMQFHSGRQVRLHCMQFGSWVEAKIPTSVVRHPRRGCST